MTDDVDHMLLKRGADLLKHKGVLQQVSMNTLGGTFAEPPCKS